jgi:hypothetical protein
MDTIVKSKLNTKSKLLERVKRDSELAKKAPSNSYTDSWLDGAEWGDGSH